MAQKLDIANLQVDTFDPVDTTSNMYADTQGCTDGYATLDGANTCDATYCGNGGTCWIDCSYAWSCAYC